MGAHAANRVDRATPSSGGACLADLPDEAQSPCVACLDGEACLTKNNGDLVCVSIDVCHALWDIGVRDVCRYADKSLYDDKPLAPAPSTCPVVGLVCNQKCGCARADERCTGRSATRGWGICTPGVPGPVKGCRLHQSGTSLSYSTWCADFQPEIWACAVFDNGPSDPTIDLDYGLCMTTVQCQVLEGPLHMRCYDQYAKAI